MGLLCLKSQLEIHLGKGVPDFGSIIEHVNLDPGLMGLSPVLGIEITIKKFIWVEQRRRENLIIEFGVWLVWNRGFGALEIFLSGELPSLQDIGARRRKCKAG